MNIQSISQLPFHTNDFNTLSSTTNLIEVSYLNNGIYESKYIDLGVLLANIGTLIQNIDNYLPLSGGTMNGKLTINAVGSCLSVTGETALQNTTFSNTAYTAIPVRIADGILYCDEDIHGCALSAKWA